MARFLLFSIEFHQYRYPSLCITAAAGAYYLCEGMANFEEIEEILDF